MKIFPQHYLVVAMMAACPSLFAADIDEVIVTASPFLKDTETVNKPVNVLSGTALTNAASATLGETLGGELGVNSASFGPGVGMPVIRGQSDNRVKVMQDSVGSMDASAASPDHAITLEPLLANKIEVLRGPSALRYGSGAIGGVVNVIDNRIPDHLPDGIDGGIELRNASVNDEAVGVVNIDTAISNIAFHVDAIARENNNLAIPSYAHKMPDESSQTSKGYIANTDAETHSHTLGSSYIGEQGFIGASVNKVDNNYGVPPDGDEFVRIDMQQTRYDLKGELESPLAGFEKISARVGHNDYQHTEMENGIAGTQFTNDAYEGRVELIHSSLPLFATQWNGAIGLQMAESEFAALGEEAFIPRSNIHNVGVFIIEETQRNAWIYEIGARLDRQKISPKNDPAGEPENSAILNHNSTNLSASATWNFTEQQKLSISLAQSQRAPSVEELLAEGPHPATGSYLFGDRELQEETSRNVELGYHWHNQDIEFSTNVFYNQFEDFIYTHNLNEIIDDLNGYQYTQAKATFKGFETELKFPLSCQWNVRLFSDSVRATLDDGGDLPRIPPLRLGSSLELDVGRWNANLSFVRSTKQDHPGENENVSQGFNRLDARVNYTVHNPTMDYTLFLKASNLLDAEIRNASSYLRDIAPEPGKNLQFGVRLTF